MDAPVKPTPRFSLDPANESTPIHVQRAGENAAVVSQVTAVSSAFSAFVGAGGKLPELLRVTNVNAQ